MMTSTTDTQGLGPRKGAGVLEALLNGYRSTSLLYVAAKLGLADLLAHGPLSSAALARSLGAHAPSLHRLLRALVAVGVCSEEHDGRFGLTRLGTWLQTDTPGSLRGLAILTGEESVGAWGGLVHTAMTGETGFHRAFGLSQWEHRAQHPELNEYFNAWLRRDTARVADAILSAYDFSPFGAIADIGGGSGALLAAVLKAYPSARGILFDQPHVVAGARACLEAAGVASRCRVVGGSFFDRMPDGADLHILKSVIHDWDDEQSLAILRNCRQALKQQGMLLVVERLMPERVDHDPDVVLADVDMLAVTGGRERTEGEYRSLLAAAGLAMTRVIPTPAGLSMIEAMPSEAEEESSDPPDA